MNQDIEILRYLAKKDKQIEKLYNKLIYQLSKVSLNITKIREGAFFSFDDYPEIKKKVDDILDSYSLEQQDMILGGIKDAVKLSFKVNTAVLSEFSRFSDKALRDMRDSAVNSFIQTRMKPKEGLSLSQKVWNYTRQAKAEFEAGMSEILEDGMSVGMSAEELGRKVRDKLKVPDMVYRRYHTKKLTATGKKDVIEWRRKVIDSEGKVRYIKEDLEKVGRGVYRSSRKNALRLTATEINMAYRYADNARWQAEPFVIGFRIQLSDNHTLNGKPFYDMCDELIGDYPKWFRWAGWHPRCRCIATSILVSKEEMMKIAELPEEEYKRYRSPNLITKMPQNYDAYVEENRDRILASMDRGTSPYWVRDNYKNGDIDKGFYWQRKGKTKFKTDEQKAAIQAAWDLRRRKNAIKAAAEKRHANRDAKAIQEAWIERKMRYAKLRKIAGNVWIAALEHPWVDSTNLQFLINRKKYHLLEAEYREIAKEVAKSKKQKSMLSALIPDIDYWARKFSYDELKSVYDSVEKKLAYFSTLSLEKQKAKLMFEVYDYLGGNMNGVQDKYPTWTVSRAAYLKQLGIVENKLFIQTIQPDMDDVVAWSTQHTKATAVAAKVQYLKDLISQDSLDIDEISKHMKDLKSHIAYLDKEAAQRAARKKAGKSLSQGFDDDAYSQERKNNAYYFKSKTGNNQAAYDQADAFMSHYAEQNWKDWNDEEKHVAYLYTSGSRYVNEPLFGTYYSTKVSPHDGSIRDSWKDINTLTDMIENSERLQHDMWVVHGENTAAFMGKFNVDLSRMSEADAQKLIGQIGWNAPFTSTGCSFGSGFSSQDVIMNIYCPKGTKGIYVEPYSHYGDSGYGEKAMNWNGKSRQAAGYKTSYENELLLQRGTSFRITKIEKRGWTWYVDVEVVEQPVMKHNTIR